MDTSRPVPEKFLVAFSFAGEQRELVRSVAEAVEQRLGRGTVFFDEWYEYYVAGAAADDKLVKIYSAKSELVVMCVSEEYGKKKWTTVEGDAVRALRMDSQESSDERARDRVLPLRVGDGITPGILTTTIAPDIRGRPPEATAELILSRLQWVCPAVTDRIRANLQTARQIYLARTHPDLDDGTRPISRGRMKAFLEELGWTVLPRDSVSVAEAVSQMVREMRECDAFVQLLGPCADENDRRQNEAAEKAGITRFRFRSLEIDLSRLEEGPRQLLSAKDVHASGFEDFKSLVGRELALLRVTPRYDPPASVGADTLPLVRVAIRSKNPEALWEKVFPWIYDQDQITSDQIVPEESLSDRQKKRPCHGVLVVCDATEQEDTRLSAAKIVEQCLEVQLSEKSNARRPPVALVYWPPPDPSWAKLLTVKPVKLTRILGNAPHELDGFFAEVSKVAQ